MQQLVELLVLLMLGAGLAIIKNNTEPVLYRNNNTYAWVKDKGNYFCPIICTVEHIHLCHFKDYKHEGICNHIILENDKWVIQQNLKR